MTQLHHLALGARDVGAVAAFYRDVLRLPQVATHRYEDGALRSIWLSLGNAVLMVEHTTQERVRVDGVGAGAFLIAVQWADGLVSGEEWLQEHGVTIEARSQYSLYSRDPEGNRVALSVYPIALDEIER